MIIATVGFSAGCEHRPDLSDLPTTTGGAPKMRLEFCRRFVRPLWLPRPSMQALQRMQLRTCRRIA